MALLFHRLTNPFSISHEYIGIAEDYCAKCHILMRLGEC
jgi:hypothetical protein